MTMNNDDDLRYDLGNYGFDNGFVLLLRYA
jgi:hypothetical protein